MKKLHLFLTVLMITLLASASVAEEIGTNDKQTVYGPQQIKHWKAADFDGQRVIVSPMITTQADEMNRHRLKIRYIGPGSISASVIHGKSSRLEQNLAKKHLRGRLYKLENDSEKVFNSNYSLEKYAWIALKIDGDVEIESLSHICYHGKNTIYGHIPLNYDFADQSLPYRLMLPKNYNPAEDKKYPLVLSIGGSGSMGQDNIKNMEMVILGMYLSTKYYDNPDMACFSLVPQVPHPRNVKAPYYPNGPKGAPSAHHPNWPSVNAQGWYTQATLSLIKTLMADPRLKIDPDRIYLTGFSLGGKGCWEFMKADPDMFAATICGAGWPIGQPYSKPTEVALYALNKEIQAYKHIPIAIYAGEKDPMKYSSKAVYELLKKAGSDCSYTEIPGANHVSSASKIWAISKNIKWLFEQKRK